MEVKIHFILVVDVGRLEVDLDHAQSSLTGGIDSLGTLLL